MFAQCTRDLYRPQVSSSHRRTSATADSHLHLCSGVGFKNALTDMRLEDMLSPDSDVKCVGSWLQGDWQLGPRASLRHNVLPTRAQVRHAPRCSLRVSAKHTFLPLWLHLCWRHIAEFAPTCRNAQWNLDQLPSPRRKPQSTRSCGAICPRDDETHRSSHI